MNKLHIQKYTDNLLKITIVIGIVLLTNIFNCLIWQHKCVIHKAAFFESNSWGLTTFHWDDDSYAHVPETK